jgi:uncharacterized membrane-anchored protein
VVRNAIVLLWCVVVLVLVNRAILDKEQLLAEGRVVFLELAPVDPRSLMQGDYMALRFRIADGVQALRDAADPARMNGTMVAMLDARSVATFERLDSGQPLGANEVRLQYRVREGQLKFATNAFFFEEGNADLYAGARYGEFRVDDEGALLLTGLRGPNLERLGQP